MNDNTVRIEGVKQLHSSAKSIYYDRDGRRFWIPIAMIKDYGDDWIEIPEWLAIDRELV